MAIIELTILSEKLLQNTNITIVVPENTNRKETKILTLLHGYLGNNKDWSRFVNVEELSNKYNVLVVMPSGDNSFYTNKVYGANYFDYIAYELREIIQNVFNIKLTNENSYIAGLSMGGYGALKIALNNPENYNGVASLSGVLDIKRAYQEYSKTKEFISVFGDKETFEKNINIHDLFFLATNKDLNNLNLYIACGKQDFLFNSNELFHKHLTKNNIKHTYYITKGDHTWDYWDKELKNIMKVFFS